MGNRQEAAKATREKRFPWCDRGFFFARLEERMPEEKQPDMVAALLEDQNRHFPLGGSFLTEHMDLSVEAEGEF